MKKNITVLLMLFVPFYIMAQSFSVNKEDGYIFCEQKDSALIEKGLSFYASSFTKSTKSENETIMPGIGFKFSFFPNISDRNQALANIIFNMLGNQDEKQKKITKEIICRFEMSDGSKLICKGNLYINSLYSLIYNIDKSMNKKHKESHYVFWLSIGTTSLRSESGLSKFFKSSTFINTFSNINIKSIIIGNAKIQLTNFKTANIFSSMFQYLSKTAPSAVFDKGFAEDINLLCKHIQKPISNMNGIQKNASSSFVKARLRDKVSNCYTLGHDNPNVSLMDFESFDESLHTFHCTSPYFIYHNDKLIGYSFQLTPNGRTDTTDTILGIIAGRLGLEKGKFLYLHKMLRDGEYKDTCEGYVGKMGDIFIGAERFKYQNGAPAVLVQCFFPTNNEPHIKSK